jgi:hypothetical protein
VRPTAAEDSKGLLASSSVLTGSIPGFDLAVSPTHLQSAPAGCHLVSIPHTGFALTFKESRSRFGDEFVDDPLRDADGVRVRQPEDEVLEAGVDGTADRVSSDVGLVIRRPVGTSTE